MMTVASNLTFKGSKRACQACCWMLGIRRQALTSEAPLTEVEISQQAPIGSSMVTEKCLLTQVR